MVEFNLDSGKGADTCDRGKAADVSGNDAGGGKDLTKEHLESIFAEEDPHKQFE